MRVYVEFHNRAGGFFSFGWLVNSDRVGNRFITWIDDHLTSKRLTVKEFLKSEIDIEYYYRHPRNYSRRSVFYGL